MSDKPEDDLDAIDRGILLLLYKRRGSWMTRRAIGMQSPAVSMSELQKRLVKLQEAKLIFSSYEASSIIWSIGGKGVKLLE